MTLFPVHRQSHRTIKPLGYALRRDLSRFDHRCPIDIPFAGLSLFIVDSFSASSFSLSLSLSLSWCWRSQRNRERSRGNRKRGRSGHVGEQNSLRAAAGPPGLRYCAREINCALKDDTPTTPRPCAPSSPHSDRRTAIFLRFLRIF